jgi:hypothetical protein
MGGRAMCCVLRVAAERHLQGVVEDRVNESRRVIIG